MRVIALERGARGVVKADLLPGSLFLFRIAYLVPASPFNSPDELVSTLESAFISMKEIDEGIWAPSLLALGRASSLYEIEKKALACLARREHSRAELEKKLKKKEIQAADIGIVLDQLEFDGLLSNERFAQAWIRSRLRAHPEGEWGLKEGLRAKGVAKDLAAQNIEENREEILAGLKRLAQRIYKAAVERERREKEKGLEPPASGADDVLRRCYAKLRARGYSHRDVKGILAELSGKNPSIDESDSYT